MRDRLKELIRNAKSAMKAENLSCDIARNMFVADFLIANGVTVQDDMKMSDELLAQLKTAPITTFHEEPTIELVQEWISVKDRLPDREDANEGGFVLAHTEEKVIIVRWGNVCRFPEFVTHWMPLPQPPKGE